LEKIETVPTKISQRRAIILTWVLAAIIGWPAPGRASTATPDSGTARIVMDPARTTIAFKLDTVAHTVHGTFHLKTAAITVAPRTGRASGEIIIDAGSGQSGNRMRDSRMRNSILEVSKYPEITFVPQRAELEGAPRGQPALAARLIGALAIHGSSHQLTLPLLITRHGDDFTVNTRFVIPYVAWGMEDPSMLFLSASKQVEIDVTGFGHISWISRTAAQKCTLCAARAAQNGKGH
jgi:polyisoprenoid-binding protein YceI